VVSTYKYPLTAKWTRPLNHVSAPGTRKDEFRSPAIFRRANWPLLFFVPAIFVFLSDRQVDVHRVLKCVASREGSRKYVGSFVDPDKY
jgi:hypothetical protein